ncbi:MAG: hypothetical protein Q8R15_03495 [Candidatus Micrarchaeota archaeon]|nr:hypothetical protein [Candidatus Micrarchaeota archaeon]
MVKIGTLEVRTVKTPMGRVKVVKLPGHEYPIEHFLPENYERERKIGYNILGKSRATYVTSRIGSKPTFVKKQSNLFGLSRLNPLSEVRLATHINALNIPGIKAEQPLAVIMHSTGAHSAIYRKLEGKMQTMLFEPTNAAKIRIELKKHGIIVGDLQWFADKGQTTLFDLEYFGVSEVLRKKLGLK